MAKKKPKTEGVVEFPGTIKRTNSFFISVKSYGNLDENGKVIFSIGCKGKIVDHPDKPLKAVAVLLEDLLQVTGCSSFEAAEKDLNEFKTWVNGLEVKKPEVSECQEQEG